MNLKISKKKFLMVLAKNGLKQKDVVEKTGLGKGNLSNAISGKSVRPLTVYKVSTALGVEPEEILEEV